MRSASEEYLGGKRESTAYIHEHAVNELMEYLFNDVILHKPDDPVSHMIDNLENLKFKNQSVMFSESNLETMFNLIDINSRGTITSGQLIKCLENLDVPLFDINKTKSKLTSKDSIDKSEFCQVMKEALDVLKLTPYN